MRTLKYVAKEALMDMELDNSYLERFLHLGFKCYRRYILDHAKSINVKKLEINDLLEAKLPDDFIDWTAIYYPSRGRKITFIPDSGIAHAGGGQSLQSTSPAVFDRFKRQYGDLGVRMSEGVVTRSAGYFNIDDKRRAIQFNALRVEKCNVYLEYLSNECLNKANLLVHEYAIDMFVEYIKWYHIKDNSRVPAVQKQQAKQEFEEAEYDFRLRNSNITIKGIIEALSAPVFPVKRR